MTKVPHSVGRERGAGRATRKLRSVVFRRGGTLFLGLAGLLALTGAIPAGASSPAPSPTPGPTSPPTPAEAALQQQANSLEQQIMALQLRSAPLLYDAVQAQQRAAAAQTQLAQERLALANADVALAQTTAQLTSVQAQLATDREQLAAIILTTYETNGSNTVLTELANSKNLGQTVDTLVSLSQITDSMTTLVHSVRDATERLAHLQAEQRAQEQQIQQQADAVQAQANQAVQDEAMYQQQAANLTGPAAHLTAQLQGVLANLAAAEGQQVQTVTLNGLATGTLDGALPPFAFGPRVDDFAWGQCTWYVASLVTVTWGGDAWTWISHAAAQGEPEGMTPKPGAIVVWSPGGGGSSTIGHVAYVATVASPTSFVIDEANWQGLGVVDQRLVSSLDGVEGFIYPT